MATKRKPKAAAGAAHAEQNVRKLRAEVEAAGLRSMLAAYGSGTRATYRGAARTRLDTAWSPLPGVGVRQANRSLRESFRSLRARARQLEQDNVLAGGVLDRAVENVIGGGFRIVPMSSSPAFNAAAAKAWATWTRGTRADVRHMHTFAALQQLAYRGKLRDGDGGVLLTEELDLQGRSHPRLQIIEGEHIDNPAGGVRGEDGTPLEVIDGVELGPNDEAVAFHLLPRDGVGGKTARVRARDFVYLCRPGLYSSVRGESVFNGGWTLFDQIVGYLEAVVVASRVGACQAGIIKTKSPARTLNGLANTPGSPAAGEARKSFNVEPGSINFLEHDDEFVAYNPAQPQQQMESAINTFCRFIGLRLGLTIEQVLLDFSRTSYSSARAARLQAQATAEQEQGAFAATFFARVYPWAVAKWVKAGLIDVPAPEDGSAGDFEWIPPSRPWIDPTKEIAAAKEAIGLNLDARSFIAAERGYTFEQLVAANKADNEKLAAAGLVPPPAPPAVTVNEAGQLTVGGPAAPAPAPQPQDAANG